MRGNVFAIIFIAFHLSFATLFASRTASLGEFSFAIPEYDGDFGLNPARLALISPWAFHIDYGWILPGFGSEINANLLTAKVNIKEILNTGLLFEQFGNEIYKRQKMGLYLGRGFAFSGPIRIALGGGILINSVSYDPSKGTYVSGRDNPYDPIFSSGRRQSGLGVDFGFVSSINDKFFFGGAVRNIGNPSVEIAKKRTLPIESGFGLAARVYGFLFKGDILLKKESEKNVRLWAFGIEKESIYKGLGLRAGISTSSFGAGATFRMPDIFGGLVFDYSIVLPRKDIREFTQMNHYIGFTLFLRERKPEGIELKAVSVEKDCICAENLCKIKGVVKNYGTTPARGFSCGLRLRASGDSTYRVVFPFNYVEKLEPEAEETLVWVFNPEKRGKASIIFSVDDDGSGFPRFKGKIDEKDEEDNICSTSVSVDTSLVVKLDHSIDTLFFDSIKVVSEEEPILPLLFFKPNSTSVNPFYNRFIMEWVGRLYENPDVLIEIFGYVDTSSESNNIKLAFDRAENVKHLFVEYGGEELGKRIRISIEHDVYKQRISIKDTQSLWKSAIDEENRRVEIKAVPLYPDTFYIENIFQDIQLDDRTVKEVSSNPGVYLFILAGDTSNVEALKKAHLVRTKIVEKYSDLDGKIRILPKKSIGKRLIIYADASGVLYHPLRTENFVEEPENIRIPLDTIKLFVSDISCIKNYSARIVDRKGRIYREFSEQAIREHEHKIIWDLRDDWGSIVLPGTNYKLLLSLKFGEKNVNFESEPVYLVSTQGVRIKRRMIFVEFVFDEIIPESDYLESRVEELVDLVISKGDSGRNFYFYGYTDTIGTESRNMALSFERANQEIKLFYDFLMFKLNLGNLDEVQKWLAKKKISVSSKGFGSSKPLTIYSIIDGRRKLLNIGNNSTPYGRSINRRVIVEWE